MSIVEANSIYESLKLHSQVPENTPEAIQESKMQKFSRSGMFILNGS